MKQKIRRKLVWGGAALLYLVSSRTASAQTVYTEKTATKLKTPVHLRLGATTLPAVLASLSKQTGVTVQAEPFLAHRKLIVQLDDITAATVLDTLCELNGWVWRETDADTLRVAPPTPRHISKLSEVPAALQATLPKDVRNYQGLNSRKEDFPEITEPNLKFMMDSRATLDPSGAQGMAERASQRHSAALSVRAEALLNALHPDLDKGKPIYYKQLAASQKADLQTLLLLRFPIPSIGSSFRLYHDRLTAYQRDPMKAVIKLEQGNGLNVGATENGWYMGFGEPIQGLTLKPTRPPFPLDP